MIAAAFVAITVLGITYPWFAMLFFGVLGFVVLWGLMDSLFGHHFERGAQE